jgi:hypothetical protein
MLLLLLLSFVRRMECTSRGTVSKVLSVSPSITQNALAFGLSEDDGDDGDGGDDDDPPPLLLL